MFQPLRLPVQISYNKLKTSKLFFKTHVLIEVATVSDEGSGQQHVTDDGAHL